eukprot:EG_transcript_28555
MVDSQGSALFGQTFKFPHTPVRRVGQAPRPGPLEMRLLHLQRHMLPQEVDMLRISVETLDGLHGRLRVVSPKLLLFDLHLTAKVDRRPSSPSPASPSRSMSAHKSKATVRQLGMLQRVLEKERRRSSELLEDIRRYQEQASGSEGEATPTSKRGGRHHSTSFDVFLTGWEMASALGPHHRWWQGRNSVAALPTRTAVHRTSAHIHMCT